MAGVVYPAWPIRMTLGDVVVVRWPPLVEDEYSSEGPVTRFRPAVVVATALLTIQFGKTSRGPRVTKKIRGRVEVAGIEPDEQAWVAAERAARAACAARVTAYGLIQPVQP